MFTNKTQKLNDLLKHPATVFMTSTAFVSKCEFIPKYVKSGLLPTKVLKTMFKSSASAVKNVENVVGNLEKCPILKPFSTLLKKSLSTKIAFRKC